MNIWIIFIRLFASIEKIVGLVKITSASHIFSSVKFVQEFWSKYTEIFSCQYVSYTRGLKITGKMDGGLQKANINTLCRQVKCTHMSGTIILFFHILSEFPLVFRFVTIWQNILPVSEYYFEKKINNIIGILPCWIY